MKKSKSILLILILSFLVACSNGPNKTAEQTNANQTNTATEQTNA